MDNEKIPSQVRDEIVDELKKSRLAVKENFQDHREADWAITMIDAAVAWLNRIPFEIEEQL